jgi:hypothetical protein
MRYLSILLLIGVTLKVNGQQINPVPDYIFRNSMSVGRNAPTDTSAYFSIGPRFGATRGFMPPMVVDTAAVTGTKRNGLLIYSIQRNSFLYWDSTGSRWSRIAANLDTLQLSTRAWRQKGDDSLAAIINTRTDTVNLLSTKAWRQKGIDSVAGLARVTGSATSGQIAYWNGTTSQAGEDSLKWDASANTMTILGRGGNVNSTFPYAPINLRNTDTTDGTGTAIQFYGSAQNGNSYITGSINVRNTSLSSPGQYASGDMIFQTTQTSGNMLEGFRLTSQQEVLVGTTTDNGAYSLQVGGNGLYASSTFFPSAALLSSGSNATTTVAGGTVSLLSRNTSITTGAKSNIYFQGVNQSGIVRSIGGIGGIYTPGVSEADGQLQFFTASSGNFFEGFRLTASQETLFGTSTDAGDFRVQISGSLYVTNNVGIGQTTFGTSAAKVMAFNNGTAPSTSPADAFQLYSADITAGNAAAHFRTENGAVIKIYQETTGVAGATRAAVAGNTVSDADTFDGYTVPQVVKALRNLGILQ